MITESNKSELFTLKIDGHVHGGDELVDDASRLTNFGIGQRLEHFASKTLDLAELETADLYTKHLGDTEYSSIRMIIELASKPECRKELTHALGFFACQRLVSAIQAKKPGIFSVLSYDSVNLTEDKVDLDEVNLHQNYLFAGYLEDLETEGLIDSRTVKVDNGISRDETSYAYLTSEQTSRRLLALEKAIGLKLVIQRCVYDTTLDPIPKDYIDTVHTIIASLEAQASE